MMQLLDESQYDPALDTLIFLGDYVDRGPRSDLVVEKVLELVDLGAVALKGNHEQMMCQALIDNHSLELAKLAREQWFANGGEKTLWAYENYNRKVIGKHLNFLAKLPVWHRIQDTWFVHAGIRPNRSLAEQSLQDLIWIRDEYIRNYRGPQIVVSGHTPTQYLRDMDCFPDSIDYSKPVFYECKLFMDTGAAWSGKLSLMDLISDRLWQA